MTLKIFIASIAVLIVGTLLDHARADVGYVCDGNVVVMVAPTDLERMKRENACVASHYGLKVVPPETKSRSGTAMPPANVETIRPEPSRTASPNGLPILRGALKLDQEISAPQAPAAVSLGGSVRLINSAPAAAD